MYLMSFCQTCDFSSLASARFRSSRLIFAGIGDRGFESCRRLLDGGTSCGWTPTQEATGRIDGRIIYPQDDHAETGEESATNEETQAEARVKLTRFIVV